MDQNVQQDQTCYPINYDFGKNWDTKVRPFLDHKEVKKAIRKGVTALLRDNPSNPHDVKYRNNTAPAEYGRGDHYATLTRRLEDQKIEQLRASGELDEQYQQLEKDIVLAISDDEDEDDLVERLEEVKAEMLKPHFTWDKIKYNIETYYMARSCYFWAPTFELTLARLVEPTERWRVREGHAHSTVINEEGTKTFDLLYWCVDRLDHHLFGNHPPRENDQTLGGRQAYIDSNGFCTPMPTSWDPCSQTWSPKSREAMPYERVKFNMNVPVMVVAPPVVNWE